jgi:hypothetical protein
MIEKSTSRVVVRRLIASAYARDRLAEAFRDILTDSLSFGPRGLPDPDDREWVRGAIAMPIQNATDAAIEAITVEITYVIERGPDELVNRLAESRRGQELGWE